ncbi:VanZ family protein [Metasolibacillus meyeri]|uniref:VanZ family protein n=1 Tax=Metasolibacillus meyeri TaxID=1071052 RepID=UPI001EE69720|nr:VanZ family protein [Metasolibacillus meyeri]
MIGTYTGPIFIAALAFVMLTFVIWIPWLIYTYRKYGFLSISKTIITFSFIFYFLAALFLVLLPLPETTNTCAMQRPGTQFFNLRPLQFVQDILYKTDIALKNPASWAAIIKQPAFYQAFFNFLLLMPFGVYLRYFLKERKYWKRAFLLGIGLTLFYEITQVTGIYGIYNCPYRIFDVDDLLLNSTGSLLGFFIAPVIWALFPKHTDVIKHGQEMIAQSAIRPLQILLAIIVDLALISIGNTALSFLTIPQFFIQTALYVVIFAIIPLLLHGETLGMKLLKIRLVDENTELFSAIGIIRRFVAIYSTYLVFKGLHIVGQIELNMDSPFYIYQVLVSFSAFVLSAILALVLAIHVLRFLLARGQNRLYVDTVGKCVVRRK